MKTPVLALTLLVCSTAIYGQTVKKVRVLAAPTVNQTDPKDWDNTLSTTGHSLVLSCPKCAPKTNVTVPADDIAELRYGQNAYHHWVSGVVTGFFTMGVGAIVGFMPHHQHFFSIDLKSGKVLAIQADKHNYREIAGMLENTTGLPIEVAQKDQHFLAGFNLKTESTKQ